MRRQTILAIAVALLVSLPAAPSRADIYQYVDETGVLHFTNVDGGGKHRRRIKSEPKKSRKSAAAGNPRPDSRQPDSPADVPSAYSDIIGAACDRYGVDPMLVHAIVKVESDFNPYALSSKGAMGLMQLMPQTAVNMNIRNSFNPKENIEGGVKYLRYLLDRYEGNVSLALAAYNSGETAVQRWGSIPPFKETQNYVKRILMIYNGGNNAFASGRNGTFSSHFTIYMGYDEDGSLLLTDNPSNHPDKNLRPRTHKTL
jgi:soluble lytic murein transglycosylase-like protein